MTRFIVEYENDDGHCVGVVEAEDFDEAKRIQEADHDCTVTNVLLAEQRRRVSRKQADIYQIIFTVKDYQGEGEFNPSAMAYAMQQHALNTEGVDPTQYSITYETRRMR